MSPSSNLPTPVPVGSPHIGRPPLFGTVRSRQKHGESEEKRDYARRQMDCDVWLLDLQSQSVLRCKTDDICDAGLHASSPVGFGLAIGQRYEVRVADRHGIHVISPQLAKSLGYGTIVRTELRINDDDPHRVGFALRFDLPQLIPV